MQWMVRSIIDLLCRNILPTAVLHLYRSPLLNDILPLDFKREGTSPQLTLVDQPEGNILSRQPCFIIGPNFRYILSTPHINHSYSSQTTTITLRDYESLYKTVSPSDYIGRLPIFGYGIVEITLGYRTTSAKSILSCIDKMFHWLDISLAVPAGIDPI